MALLQTVELAQEVTGTGISPPLYSRWVAVHNPVFLQWTRRDYETTTAYAAGLYLGLAFAASTGATVGDLLYVNTTAYEGLATITSFSGDNIITDVSFGIGIGTYPGYVNNLTARPNYYIEVQLQNHSNSVLLATLQATPDTTGVIKLDISGALQSYTSNPDTLELLISPNGEADDGSTVQFKYRAAERWRPAAGLVEQPYGSYSNNCFGINGAFQAGHIFNGNYAGYYANQYAPKLFVTDFSRGKYFAGYPFDVAYIYPPELDVETVFIVTSFYNAAGVQVGGSSSGISSADVGKLNRCEPDPDIDTWGEKVVSAMVQLQISPSDAQIITPWHYDIVNTEDLPCNGIYLQWLGALGNRSYYLFNDKYAEALQVEGGDTYQSAFDTIDDLTERANWYEKKPFKKLTLGAEGLTRVEIEGLKSLLTSTKVDVLTGGNLTWARTGVLLEPGTFSIGRGSDEMFKIEFTIVFPEQFNQTA